MARSSTDKGLHKLAQEWFKKAQADIDFANLGLRETEHYGEVCFLCQQAAEKYLKGFLVANNIAPKKIHSTAALITKCASINREFNELVDQCKVLDRYYIPPRYPVPAKIQYHKQDAREAIETTESIIALVLRLLK
ncbi:MAG TPA: HEPN domain-containing protein [Candidatus Omnitrophota bacterium]|nr:HEPN domain-containing protein [Candidatus Omnitrophota bacterium]